MNRRNRFITLFSLLLVSLVCIGMVLAEMEEILEDREIALVRRYIPNAVITNVDQELVEVGKSLFSGDTLVTDEEGFAMILFMDQSVTRVRPESQLIVRGEVNRDRSATTRIDVNAGEIFMNVNRQANSDVEVGTASSVASVKGTTFGARSSGYYWVEEGEVEVMALESGQMVTITENMFAQVNEDGTEVTSGAITEEEKRELGSGYSVLDTDLQERRMQLRFRDANGQVREFELELYEQEN
ncbi:MAG: FecR family protein [Balneolaceae bacterium]